MELEYMKSENKEEGTPEEKREPTRKEMMRRLCWLLGHPPCRECRG